MGNVCQRTGEEAIYSPLFLLELSIKKAKTERRSGSRTTRLQQRTTKLTCLLWRLTIIVAVFFILTLEFRVALR